MGGERRRTGPHPALREHREERRLEIRPLPEGRVANEDKIRVPVRKGAKEIGEIARKVMGWSPPP